MAKSKGGSNRQGRSPTSPVSPTLPHRDLQSVVFAILLPILTTLLTFHLTPPFLHPLFGSIPVALHLPRIKLYTLLFSSFLSAVPLPPATKTWIPSVGGISVALIPVGVRRVGKITGGYGGAIGGAVGALGVLTVPVVVLSCRVWTEGALNVVNQRRLASVQQASQSNRRAGVALLFTAVVIVMERFISLPVGKRGLEVLTSLVKPEFRQPEVLLAVVSALHLIPARKAQAPTLNQPRTSIPSRLSFAHLTLIGLTLLAHLRPRQFPYTVSLPATPSPPGAPEDRPSPAISILNSTEGLTGRIVVGENLEYGYRFLRCDHSLLGGRFVKRDEETGKVEYGDSIFSTFVLQDVAKFVEREVDEKRRKTAVSAEIVGLGVGISAQSMLTDGIRTHVIEIDPAVYHAARQYFGLSKPHRVILSDGGKLIEDRAAAIRNSGTLLSASKRLDYVIHDCFTGGSVPAELFTSEFWWDLMMSVKADGVLVVNFAGQLKSRASKAVIATLYDNFPQCRAFGDMHGTPANATGNELMNMVILCSMDQTQLLTFRDVTPDEIGYSYLKHRVYTTFLDNEILIADQVMHETPLQWIDDDRLPQSAHPSRRFGEDEDDEQEEEEDDALDPFEAIPDFINDNLYPREGEQLILKRGKGMDQLDKWQVGSAVATWEAMRVIMPVEGWMAY